MKGRTETELQVRVRVAASQALLPPDEEFAADEEWSLFFETDEQALAYQQEQSAGSNPALAVPAAPARELRWSWELTDQQSATEESSPPTVPAA